jgi:hypothetical protein
MQIELAHCVPELLALGVPDRRLSVLPTLYEPLLTDVDVLRVDQPLGLTCQQYGWLLDLSTHVAELCERLADHRIPETINRGDLNDGNVFLGDGRSIFIDWDDGCVSHPFYSLRTVLVSAEISLGLEENSPELWPLRDPYLEPWTSYGSREDLLRALELAGRLASINGALTWHRLVSKLEGREGKSTPSPCRPCCKSSSTPARRILNNTPFDGTCARWLLRARAPGYSARVVCGVGSGRFPGR